MGQQLPRHPVNIGNQLAQSQVRRCMLRSLEHPACGQLGSGCPYRLEGIAMAKEEIRSIVLNVRLRPSLKAALEKLAAQDKRTLSNFIELVLERVVDDTEGKPKRRS